MMEILGSIIRKLFEIGFLWTSGGTEVKLSELKIAVDHAITQSSKRWADKSPEEVEVVIDTFKMGVIGPSPCTLVKAAGLGFDWNSGRFQIWPSSTLREIDLDEIKRIRDRYAEEDWMMYNKMQLSKEITKLRNRVKELEEHK